MSGGTSASTSFRNAGCAALPLVGPANTVFAVCVFNVMSTVPVVVTGEPLTVYIGVVDVSLKATLVTPVFAIVIEPAPFVMLIPVPAVKVALTGAALVEPINNWPFVGAVVEDTKPPVPEYKNAFAVLPETVNVVAAVIEPGALNVDGILNTIEPVEPDAVISFAVPAKADT